MNPWLALAAALAVILGAGHSYLGERFFFARLVRHEPLAPLLGADAFSRRTLRFVWHLTTVAWWGAAALFWALGEGRPRGARSVSVPWPGAARWQGCAVVMAGGVE
jgi:hypothetical protein